MKIKINNDKNKILFIVIIINILIFLICNFSFDVKYEQVDDFIIYNLYSGLDGTYNIHGIYIHPVICLLLGVLFRIIPMINWHTIFLITIQFICFTTIGYTIIKRHRNNLSIILYTIFASIFYTTLLMLIQYTSVSALLILTSFFIIFDKIENECAYKISIISVIMFTIGVMIRIQSLLIIIPFYLTYFLISTVKYKKKIIDKSKYIFLIKNYLIYLLIAILIYISNMLIYNTNKIYKEYLQYNKARSALHDIINVDYKDNKEIYDNIGWTENDYYLFNTFNFGDENIYSKDNINKILKLKKQQDNEYGFNTEIFSIINSYFYKMINGNKIILVFFTITILLNLTFNDKKRYNIFFFVTTILTHLVFIIINRDMLRVVIPEYIIGTSLMIYDVDYKQKEKIKNQIINYINITVILVLTINITGLNYNYNYSLDNYNNYRQLIDYTNKHKENVYLYTIPSLQYRYLSYSVYKMPPKEAFSNLRHIGRMGYVYWKLLRF